MPNVPMPQPNDVASLYSNAGKAAGAAVQDIGTAVDTYNEVQKWRADEKKRVELRQALLTEYKFKPEDIPEKTSFDELARISHNLQQLDGAHDNATKNGATGIPEKQQARIYALADKDHFYKGLGTLEEAAQKAAKDRATQQAQTGSAEQLKGLSEGLNKDMPPAQPISMGADKSLFAGAGSGDQTRMPQLVGQDARNAPGGKIGNEVPRETAQKAMMQAIDNPEQVGPQTQETFLGQYRIKDEIPQPKPKPRSGTDDSIKDNQVVSFYNQARRDKAGIEKTMKQTKLDIDSAQGELDQIKSGTHEKIAQTDTAAIAKMTAKVNDLKGELEGYQNDWGTYDSEFQSWGEEARRRNLPIGKPVVTKKKEAAAAAGLVKPKSGATLSPQETGAISWLNDPKNAQDPRYGSILDKLKGKVE